ncbi:MAG: substrate-binding domain-containing protein [Casimicrobium sp.]
MNAADTSSSAPLTGISSMATRQLLAELARVNAASGGTPIAIESVGGVDAAKRVQAGELFDVVFLASDAIAKLISSGHVLADSRVDLVRSQVAVAVKDDATIPSITDAAAVRVAVLGAASIGYSTGPSGTALLALFERWGIMADVKDKLRQAPAGVPVAAMVARGDVALGFQQRSEMIDAPGINVIGDLPTEIAIETIFSGGVCTASTRADEARALLKAFAAPAHAGIKAKHGMEGL